MRLVINNLIKTYGNPVIKDISLSIQAYDSVALIGRSGCGKSTLLRLLSAIEMPDSGSIIINELQINENSRRALQQRAGIIFQQHNLFPHLSLLKNITLILEKSVGMKAREAEVKAIRLLEQLHLKTEMNRRPGEVSGGQAQRASIARALCTEPELIFMDEPTSALDPVLTKEVLDSVLSLKHMGKQFLFASHEMNFVNDFADYVIFMDEGQVVEHGSVRILREPGTPALKQFLEYENF